MFSMLQFALHLLVHYGDVALQKERRVRRIDGDEEIMMSTEGGRKKEDEKEKVHNKLFSLSEHSS